MGFTHYWTQQRDFSSPDWQMVQADIASILSHVQSVSRIPLANGMGEHGSLPLFSPDAICFNGAGEGSYETFCVTRDRPAKQPHQSQRGSDFCKTDRKPYDMAVTACLCYFATVTETHHVTSDGSGRDWLPGLAVARSAVPRCANLLDIPPPILENDRWCQPTVLFPFTERFRFDLCVDGKAYIRRVSDSATYCFPDHQQALAWSRLHAAVLTPEGYVDAARREELKSAQQHLLCSMVERAAGEDRAQQPPAFVRPDEYPPFR